MADWVTISALATAGRTLVLASATFASVRSANRSARATERALLAGIRPVLAPSRLVFVALVIAVEQVDRHHVPLRDGGRGRCEHRILRVA